MCCLKYEQEAYEDLIRHTPKVGFHVSTPDGEGTVVEVSLLTGMLKVRLSSGDSTTENYYSKSEVRVLRNRRPRTEESTEAGFHPGRLPAFRGFSVSESNKNSGCPGIRCFDWLN